MIKDDNEQNNVISIYQNSRMRYDNHRQIPYVYFGL